MQTQLIKKYLCYNCGKMNCTLEQAQNNSFCSDCHSPSASQIIADSIPEQLLSQEEMIEDNIKLVTKYGGKK